MLFTWRRPALHGDTTRVYTAPSGPPPAVTTARWEFWGVNPRWWFRQTAPSGDAPVIAAGMQKPIWRGSARRR